MDVGLPEEPIKNDVWRCIKRGGEAGTKPLWQDSVRSALPQSTALLATRNATKEIYRAVRFDQSPWMAPYIRMNTKLRKQAKSSFEQDLYKLINNSVFGKTMENIRRRIDVKLVRSTEEEKLRKLIAKPSFNRSVMFDDNLAGIHMN